MARWYAGFGTPLVTDALVQHRDAIVGTWQPGAAVGDLGIEDVLNLKRWEPWVRAGILDFELLTSLRFGKHTDNGVANTFTLWHLDATPGQAEAPAFKRIASMVKPAEATLVAQTDLVEGYAALRDDRASEILAQLTPPTAFWSSVANLHPDRTKWTIEVIDSALRLANLVEMGFKQALAVRRPLEFSPQVQPMILTPGHGALPSGHATEAFMIAYILWTLLKSKGRGKVWLDQLMRQANRVAINRTVAGVHFPIDSAAGQMLGLTLGQYFVRRATGAGNWAASRFNGQLYNGADDFDSRKLYDTNADQRKFPAAPDPLFAEKISDETAGKAPYLEEMWKLALQEWF